MEILKYNGDFNDIISLEELKHKVYVNALCFTSTVADASKEAGVSEGSMYKFVLRMDISSKEIKEMRITFKKSKIKVKKRYKN